MSDVLIKSFCPLNEYFYRILLSLIFLNLGINQYLFSFSIYFSLLSNYKKIEIILQPMNGKAQKFILMYLI